MVVIVCSTASTRKAIWEAAEKHSVLYKEVYYPDSLVGIEERIVLLVGLKSSESLRITSQSPFSRFVVVGDGLVHGSNVKVFPTLEQAFEFLSSYCRVAVKAKSDFLLSEKVTDNRRYRVENCPHCGKKVGANSFNLRRHVQRCAIIAQRPTVVGRRKKNGPLVIRLTFPVKVGRHLFRPGYHVLVKPNMIRLLIKALKKHVKIAIEER